MHPSLRAPRDRGHGGADDGDHVRDLDTAERHRAMQERALGRGCGRDEERGGQNHEQRLHLGLPVEPRDPPRGGDPDEREAQADREALQKAVDRSSSV